MISLVSIFLLFFYGCKICDENPLITSFVFEGVSPSAVGCINQMEQSIHVWVPAGTDLTNLSPIVQVNDPECHTLSPPSGQPQDFTFPVFYEVINEMGTMKTYEVLISLQKAEATRFSEDSITIQWSTGSDMPIPTGWSASVVLNDKIYVFGGAKEDRQPVNVLQMYDPAIDQWDLSKSPPHYLRYAQGACAVNGKIYAFGGAAEFPGGPVYDDIQVYDPETDVWKDHGKMTSPREAFSTVAYHGRIYMLGGVTKESSSTVAYHGKINRPGGESNEPSSNAEILDLVEVYYPESNSWEILPPMPSPRAYLSACVVNDKIYAIGGIHKFPFLGLSTIFEYDPASYTWEEKQPLLKGRSLLSTCVVNGKIFCIGGNPLDPAAEGSTSVEVYDPARDSVYQATDMKYIRYGSASGVVNNKIYILGGCNEAQYHAYCNKTEIGIPD